MFQFVNLSEGCYLFTVVIQEIRTFFCGKPS